MNIVLVLRRRIGKEDVACELRRTGKSRVVASLATWRQTEQGSSPWVS